MKVVEEEDKLDTPDTRCGRHYFLRRFVFRDGFVAVAQRLRGACCWPLQQASTVAQYWQARAHQPDVPSSLAGVERLFRCGERPAPPRVCSHWIEVRPRAVPTIAERQVGPVDANDGTRRAVQVLLEDPIQGFVHVCTLASISRIDSLSNHHGQMAPCQRALETVIQNSTRIFTSHLPPLHRENWHLVPFCHSNKTMFLRPQ